MNGETVQDVPALVWEFMFCAVFGWTLEYVRSLTVPDFHKFSQLVLNKFVIDCQKAKPKG